MRLFNAQRSTLNAERSIQRVEHWELDVERLLAIHRSWAFSG
jgi:hypothetical protein